MCPAPQTLFEKAAQLVMVRLGSNLPPGVTAEDDRDRVAALLEDCPVGGLLVFNAHWPGVAHTLNALQGQSRFPLLVASDIERGAGQQVAGATCYPHAMAFGALDEAEAAVADFARTTAREARACGIHWAFAPVADINLHAENPIISTRAFGTEPQAVARLVRAYVAAAREAGLLTSAKHFPGHGRTTTDSHATLPTVSTPRADLVATDLLPFQAAIDAGVESVMTAHVAYSALDESGVPATLSAPILQEVLRAEMGFTGVVVSDSLLMEGVQGAHADPGTQAAALVQAGVDVLLDPKDPRALVQGLVRAVETGALDPDILDAAAQRVWRLKTRVAGDKGAASFRADPEASVVGRYQPAADRVARRALTVQHEASGAWPLPADGAGVLVIRITPRTEEPAAAPTALEEAVRTAFPRATYRAVDGAAAPAEMKALQAEAQAAARVVLALAVEPAAWHAFGLTAEQQAFVRAVTRQTPTIAAALGSPHVLDAVPEAGARLCTFSDVPAAQRALVRWLQGR